MLAQREGVSSREAGLRAIMIARCFERIGDNAVDIGEQTVYLVTGEFREFTDASHPTGSRLEAPPTAARSTSQSASGRSPDGSSSPPRTRVSASCFPAPLTRKNVRRAARSAGRVSEPRHPPDHVRRLDHPPLRPRAARSSREERGGVAVVAHAQQEHVEVTPFAEERPQQPFVLVGVG